MCGCTEGYVTNERLRYTLNIHKADIYNLLKDMCSKGYIVADGHGSIAGTWPQR